MAEARIRYDEGEPVVVWQDGYDVKPLRKFISPGAAYEFRNLINDYRKDDLERKVKIFAETYDSNKKYSYPEPTKVGIAKLKEWKY